MLASPRLGSCSSPTKGGDIAMPLMPHESPSMPLVRAASSRSQSFKDTSRWCCHGIWHWIKPARKRDDSFQPSTTQNKQDHLKKIGMDPKDYHVVKEMFTFLDKNGDGFIHKEEFFKMIKDLGMQIDEPEREFAAIDADHNGLITLDDFVEWGQVHKCGKSLSNIKAAFDAIDTTGRGHITVLDFCKLAASLDQAYSSLSEMIEAFQELDRDRDGYISWEQFARVWNEVTVTQRRRTQQSRTTVDELNWSPSLDGKSRLSS